MSKNNAFYLILAKRITQTPHYHQNVVVTCRAKKPTPWTHSDPQIHLRVCIFLNRLSENLVLTSPEAVAFQWMASLKISISSHLARKRENTLKHYYRRDYFFMLAVENLKATKGWRDSQNWNSKRLLPFPERQIEAMVFLHSKPLSMKRSKKPRHFDFQYLPDTGVWEIKYVNPAVLPSEAR